MQQAIAHEATVPGAKDRRGFSWLWALSIAIVLAVALLVFRSAHAPAPAAPAFQLRLTRDSANAGISEPIIVTGRPGCADVLFLRIQQGNQARLGYDHWGSSAQIISDPFEFPAGKEVPLEIEMPTLNGAWHNEAPRADQLRIRVASHEVLNTQVPHYPAASEEVAFGTNSVSASSCDPRFKGVIRDTGATQITALPKLSLATRALLWLRFRTTELPYLLALALLGGVILEWGRSSLVSGRTESAFRALCRERGSLTFLLCLGASCLAYVWFDTGGLRPLFCEESFGTFYDYQAASLLKGHLDVDPVSLGGEAFVVDGKTYGYFGPTPALLRIPFALLDLGFGKLSRFLMVCYQALSLVLAWRILRQMYRLSRKDDRGPSPGIVALFTLNIGLGSTLFFLSSRAYIYHEAIACGVMFALGSCLATLHHFEAPRGWHWFPALVCGMLAVHARPPAGLFALALLGFVCLFFLLRENVSLHPPRVLRSAFWKTHIAIGLLCVIGALSFNGLGYLKFGTFDGAPLRFHVQYDPPRLARFDGRNFHWVNIPFNSHAYFFKATPGIDGHFPWIFPTGVRKKDYPGTKYDHTESITSLPWAMPGLCFLSLLGLIAWMRATPDYSLFSLSLTGAFLTLSLALLTAVVHSHRYTADFCPFLIIASGGGYALQSADSLAVRRNQF